MSGVAIARNGTTAAASTIADVTTKSLGRFGAGTALFLRPRIVDIDSVGVGTALPAGTPIEGPYLRITRESIASLQAGAASDENACKDVRVVSANVGDTQAWTGTGGVAKTSTVAEPMLGGAYYEIDALCNSPLVMPFDGSVDLVTPIASCAIFDVTIVERAGMMRGLSYTQTRDVLQSATRSLFVPLGAYGLEILCSGDKTLPSINFHYEETGKVGPPNTLMPIVYDAAEGPYRHGTIMSLSNARKIDIVGGADTLAKAIFHIRMV